MSQGSYEMGLNYTAYIIPTKNSDGKVSSRLGSDHYGHKKGIGN